MLEEIKNSAAYLDLEELYILQLWVRSRIELLEKRKRLEEKLNKAKH